MSDYSHQQWEPVVLRKPGQGPRQNAGGSNPNAPAGFRPGDKKMFAGTNTQGGRVNGAQIERDLFKPTKTVGMEFKKAMETARLAKGWTRKELAEKTNLPLNTISAYESGGAKPDGTIINKLNRALGITLPKIPKPKKPTTQQYYDDEY